MNIQIVRADANDAAEILALQHLAYQSEALIYQNWTIPPLTQTLPEIMAEFSNKTFLKAQHAGRIIGSVRASLTCGTCAIGRLIVHPECRRKGIGTQLMLAIEVLFQSTLRFELFTGDRSEGNIRLYENLGYRRFRTERLSPQVVVVFMEKQRP